MSSAHVNGIADPPSSGNGASPQPNATFEADEAAAMRPEVAVGAAFLGGFLLALLLRKVRS